MGVHEAVTSSDVIVTDVGASKSAASLAGAMSARMSLGQNRMRRLPMAEYSKGVRAVLESPEEPTVRNIVACWLKAHGYSALCGDECGCSIEDLFPCCGEWAALDCRAGYWRKGTEMECYEVDQEPGSYIASLDKEAPDAEA